MLLHDCSDIAIAQVLYDPEVRAAVRTDPKQYAIDNGFIGEDAELEVKLVINTPDTLYIPLTPPRTYPNLDADDLLLVQAAGNLTQPSVASALPLPLPTLSPALET